jgi:class 3 adenylate cyclase
MNIGGWLRSFGLEHYEAAFRENAIDADVLRDLTDRDFEKLGVLLGDRRRLLRAIAALDSAPAAASSPAPVPSAAALSPTSSAVEVSDEYCHVTAVFCDLVDLTGIATQLNAEEWRGLVGAYLDAASAAIIEWGGKVSDKLGDGLTALFGYPVAKDNDLQRAAHAARAIQRSVAELNRKNDRKGDPIFAIRISIESGLMVINASGAIQQVLEPSTEQRQIHGPFVTEGGIAELKSVPRAPRANGDVPETGDGHSMSYHQLIARAVDELDSNTGEARRALYERARQALLAQLRSTKPVLVLADITRERRALEEAISQVEADATRKLRGEPEIAPPGRTADGGTQVSSAPTRRDRAKPPSTNLPEDEWPAVLFSARDRLLSVRSSRRKLAASGLREFVGDVHDFDPPETAHSPRTPQYRLADGFSRSPREIHTGADDLAPIDYRRQQERDPELDPQDAPAALPEQIALTMLEIEEEQKDPSRRELFYRGPSSRPNWSRPLPKLLIVSGVMTVATLNDARVMIERHVPVASRANEMWRYVSNQLRGAALDGNMAEFCSVLEMALSIEGLEWTLK